MRFYQDEKGNSLVITAILLPVLLLLLVLLADLGAVQLVRSQVQTAADASSLAAVAVEEDEVVLGGWQSSTPEIIVEIDESRARERAQRVALSNLEKVKNISWDISDFSFQKTGSNSYHVELPVHVHSVLLAPLFSDTSPYTISLTIVASSEIRLGGK